MIRHSAVATIRPALRLPSLVIARMAGGDTGAPRSSGGKIQSDAFQKREKANEDYAIRQREVEKLQQMREKLQKDKQHLKELEDHIEKLAKESGGEHN